MGGSNIMSVFPLTILPLTIPGCVLYVAADNPKNAALPANSSALDSWVDLSGRKDTATQATGSRQPTLIYNVAGGKPGIFFDSNAGASAGDSFRSTTSTILNALNLGTSPTGFNISICAQITASTPPSTSSGTLLFQQGSSSSSNEIYQVAHGTSGTIRDSVVDSSGNQQSLIAGTATPGTPFINTFWWDKAAGTIYGQFNNNTAVTGPGAGTITALNTTPTLFSIGQQKDSQPTRQFDGYIFEIVVHNLLLSSTDRESIKRWQAARWGVSI